jgi:aspartyl-tRNA(Asn)/glutamyl-tRNA(Gln) amidotransferase subunit A
MGQTRREFLCAGLGAGALLAAGAGPESDLTDLTLSEASEGVRTKAISPVELTKACLERIERLNPLLNAFITVAKEQTVAQAEEAEAEIMRGQRRGPLHGIPIGLKDNIDTAGTRTTAASGVFVNRVPGEDAEVVRRLKLAGAVIVGKLNLDEFAFGDTATLSHVGPVHNPWKLDTVAGGSSGGSAAAVAAHLCYGALGTDTGCSIRIPAAHCGIVGLRPSYGLVSTRGCVPLSWSLDTVGPICRTVADVAQVLKVIAGYDPEDIGSVNAPDVEYVASLEGKVRGLRAGVVRALFSKITDPDVKAAVNEAVTIVRSLGADVRDVELPTVPEATFGNVLLAESYVFHAPLLATEADHYHPVIRRRAESGATISATSYIRAHRDLERLRRVVGNVFSDVDLILAPTSYMAPPTLEQSEREQDGPIPDHPTLDLSIYGIPTISVPCGFTRSGLPIGLQISGPHLGEPKVLALAHAYEQATEWHKRRPSL